ncbi:hypothetical protein C923_03331 [Plasmodium falciparum UGT5.1]|uniref:Uncharacterized protein n=1 Tax=Plasmodium falciparum UGT5.1 TaxID=1237627 RepID=W7JB42_PLAFA|nr:hypothetical protein C923_03331 [Plasmodium falciparum UGT5.1]
MNARSSVILSEQNYYMSVIQNILVDNNFLEYVNINDIYKTLYHIFKTRYLNILNTHLDGSHTEKNENNSLLRDDTDSLKKGNDNISPLINDDHISEHMNDHIIGSRKNKLLLSGENNKPLSYNNKSTNSNNNMSENYHETDSPVQNITPLHIESNFFYEQIKLKFENIFSHSPQREKYNNLNFIQIHNLKCLKYAITACIYSHIKISGKSICLRNILNTTNFFISLLINNNNYSDHHHHHHKKKRSNVYINSLKDTVHNINTYEPIIKENIYQEKEESLKMERIALFTSSFKLSNNIMKYSLLYELMFITRSPYIINKFLLSVFNDVLCIPNINNKYDDTVIVFSCILFVNHFFYHINQKSKETKNNSWKDKNKILYINQVQKIIKLFLLLCPHNQIEQMDNIRRFTKKIVQMYSHMY